MALFFVLAALTIAVTLLVLLGRVMWEVRPRLRGLREAIAFDVVDASPARAISEHIAEDTLAQRRPLREGEPGDAIIARWQRFETRPPGPV